MNIVLTGATGFIGSSLLPQALAAGHTVLVLGRRPPKYTHSRLIPITTFFGEHLEKADIPWDRIDAVVHLAAAGVKSSSRLWHEAVDFNIRTTLRLVEMISRVGCRKPPFILAKSFYEDLVNHVPQLLESPYIATKNAATELVRMWSRQYPGPVGLANVFQVYGPGDNPANVLSYAANQFARGERAHFGSGTGMRDWIFVDDAARGFLAILENTARDRWQGVQEFDIGSGNLQSIQAIIADLAEIAGVDPKLHCAFDSTKEDPCKGFTMAASRLPNGFFASTDPKRGLQLLWNSAQLSSR